ncbi:hypothetical protein PPL_11919 [Heterostelium album PN500]|uniref:B box-type domain-containing protein n=1 Tax=Heterostelium pallidum (strain ATCC 26659 / Pp 5 / PN500) TaxID=670386 RepID=D3BUU7_HETP5|nr:hypothetical protein PPL_11919 [Heterostelium album PN500]EFA74885.1 hypothetical protein PPL_11919 [Heterostelium album PN500]|eukprot:XP_020427019.1 hypothetical protein PPL_11919 [Heterostelium album PN500]
MTDIDSSRCSIHKDELYKLICIECNVLLCSVCSVDHNGHIYNHIHNLKNSDDNSNLKCSHQNQALECGEKRYRCSECSDIKFCEECYHSPKSNECHTDKAILPHQCTIETKTDSEYLESNESDRFYQCFMNAFNSFSHRNCIGVRPVANEPTVNWLTFKDVYQNSEMFGSALKMNVKYESRVGIMLNNVPEWYFVEFGCLFYGYTLIPINHYINNDQLLNILKIGEPSVLVVSKITFPKLLNVINNYSNLTLIIHVGDDYDQNLKNQLPQQIKFKLYSEFLSTVSEIAPHSPLINGILSIVFSTGSTGVPKGEMCKDRDTTNCLKAFSLLKISLISISYLSLSHTQRLMDLTSIFLGGRFIIYSLGTEIEPFIKECSMVRPTHFWNFPTFYNQIYSKYQRRLEILKKEQPNLSDDEVDSIAIRETTNVFGDRIQHISAGGAKIAPHIEIFLKKCWGNRFFIHYGCTESYGIASNGRIKSDVEYKINAIPGFRDDSPFPVGELIVKSPRTIEGYINKDGSNEKNFRNGWFATGDIVEEYEPGFIRILERVSYSFKSSFGRFISPEIIESNFYSSSLIRNIFIYGTSLHPFLVGIVVPSQLALERFNLTYDQSNIDQHQDLKESIINEINIISKQKNIIFWEIPKAIKLDNTIWTVDNHLLNGSFKFDRKEITKYYQESLDQLLSGINENGSSFF